MSQAERPQTVDELARQRLIVALDVSTTSEALRLVASLQGVAGMFKVGLQLFSAAGPDVVRSLVRAGEKIFLDLKFHDIPNTVAAAGVEAARLGVSMFNVHAAGGRDMMMQTLAAVSEAVEKEGLERPKIIAVTVLTSADDSTLAEIGISATAAQQVTSLALLTETAGLDGVVASPQEVKLIRESVKRKGFLLVTPGVRPIGSAGDDQKRTMSPQEAIEAGSDYLVVGRPITGARDPVAAAEGILREMTRVLKTPNS
jgi:orotidine-5'-phosphate decarboxylase